MDVWLDRVIMVTRFHEVPIFGSCVLGDSHVGPLWIALETWDLYWVLR